MIMAREILIFIHSNYCSITLTFFIYYCCILSGRTAYIGLGFGDRSDSFDLNVALQDHFKWLRKEQEGEQAPQQNLDLGFKEGETIKINMKITVSI